MVKGNDGLIFWMQNVVLSEKKEWPNFSTRIWRGWGEITTIYRNGWHIYTKNPPCHQTQLVNESESELQGSLGSLQGHCSTFRNKVIL